MAPTLTKDGNASCACPSQNGISANCQCAKVDSIPSSLDLADEINRHVTQPNQSLATEIADWAVNAYREKIAKERIDTVAVLPFPWARTVMGPQVSFDVARILIRKGWHFSHNFVSNQVYIQVTAAADRVVYGPAPGY